MKNFDFSSDAEIFSLQNHCYKYLCTMTRIVQSLWCDAIPLKKYIEHKIAQKFAHNSWFFLCFSKTNVQIISSAAWVRKCNICMHFRVGLHCPFRRWTENSCFVSVIT